MFHLTRKLMMTVTVAAAIAGTSAGAALATSAPAAAAGSSVPRCYTQDLSAGLRGAESGPGHAYQHLVVGPLSRAMAFPVYRGDLHVTALARHTPHP